MDGNSTMSLGQLLSGYSEIFLSSILIILTGVLAYYTRNLSHSTSKYVDLVRSQNRIMDENMKHELLVKKYNRMLDEMKYLVAPLYASRKDPQIFIPIRLDSKIITDIETNEIDKIYYNSYEFWDSIAKNLYLCRSEELKQQLREYRLYLRPFGTRRDRKADKFYSQKYEGNKKSLVDTIEHRHDELAKQIFEIENELGISEL
jgi:hypothetical protein